MKLFKKLAGLCMAITLCFGLSAAVACGGDNPDKSSSTTSEATSETPATEGYRFKVLNADGTPAVGYQVQLCLTSGTCMQGVAIDAEGYCNYKIGTDVAYSVHVWNMDYTIEKEFIGMSEIPANYDGGDIQLKLK